MPAETNTTYTYKPPERSVFTPSSKKKTTTVIGSSGQKYKNIHIDAPISQGGGTDKLKVPTTKTKRKG